MIKIFIFKGGISFQGENKNGKIPIQITFSYNAKISQYNLK